MKKLLSTFGIGTALVIGTVTSVVFASTLTVTPPPIQGSAPLKVIVSADTVTGPVNNPAGVATCAQTNYFKRGQWIVFRSWGNVVPSGGYALTPKNVLSAVVNIPGEAALPLSYVSEPYNAPPSQQTSYWEAHWAVPDTYPLGVINFSIVFKTKKTTKLLASYTGTYRQKGFSPASQLQVTT